MVPVHTGGPAPAHLLDLEAWNDFVPGVDWNEMPTDRGHEETLAAPHLNTQTGRPLASRSDQEEETRDTEKAQIGGCRMFSILFMCPIGEGSPFACRMGRAAVQSEGGI